MGCDPLLTLIRARLGQWSRRSALPPLAGPGYTGYLTSAPGLHFQFELDVKGRSRGATCNLQGEGEGKRSGSIISWVNCQRIYIDQYWPPCIDNWLELQQEGCHSYEKVVGFNSSTTLQMLGLMSWDRYHQLGSGQNYYKGLLPYASTDLIAHVLYPFIVATGWARVTRSLTTCFVIVDLATTFTTS